MIEITRVWCLLRQKETTTTTSRRLRIIILEIRDRGPGRKNDAAVAPSKNKEIKADRRGVQGERSRQGEEAGVIGRI